MPTSDAKRAKNAEVHQRMKDQGWKRLSLWLTPFGAALLPAAAARWGSATKAVEVGLAKSLEEESPGSTVRIATAVQVEREG
jgi:hypothetical protein